MKNIGYVVEGHDGDIYFFYGRSNVRRCSNCGELLDKWNEKLELKKLPKNRYDVSASYDGVLVVSSKFKEVYDKSGMTGLHFVPVGLEHFAIKSDSFVAFDTARRKTRFENRCNVCGNWKDIVGATPVFLKEGAVIPSNGFVRTDIEFASGDEKSALLLCGEQAAMTLKKAKLKGMDLERFEYSGIPGT
jgi:hypothetical protein